MCEPTPREICNHRIKQAEQAYRDGRIGHAHMQTCIRWAVADFKAAQAAELADDGSGYDEGEYTT